MRLPTRLACMIVPLIGPLRCRVESERACPQTYITALRTGYMRLNLGNGTTRERIATPEMPRHHEAVRQGRQMTCCQLRHVQRPNIQWQAMRGRASLRKSNVFWHFCNQKQGCRIPSCRIQLRPASLEDNQNFKVVPGAVSFLTQRWAHTACMSECCYC